MQPRFLRTTTAPNLDHDLIDNKSPKLNCALLKMTSFRIIQVKPAFLRHDQTAHVVKKVLLGMQI